MRADAIRRQLISDSDSPRAFCVNGFVRNIDARYTLFDVKTTEKMHIAPQMRVHIW
ncbi:MAG: hypothetical protein ABIQ70_11845 [Dokdonella sp.]